MGQAVPRGQQVHLGPVVAEGPTGLHTEPAASLVVRAHRAHTPAGRQGGGIELPLVVVPHLPAPTHPQSPVRMPADGHVVLIGNGALLSAAPHADIPIGVPVERRAIVPDQPARPEPHLPLQVRHDPPGRRRLLGAVTADILLGQDVQPGVVVVPHVVIAAEPDPPLLVLGQGRHRQGLPHPVELVPVVPGQAAALGHADPQPALLVRQQRIQAVAGQAVRSGEGAELLPVEAAQAIGQGGQPQVPCGVLGQGVEPQTGQPVQGGVRAPDAVAQEGGGHGGGPSSGRERALMQPASAR